MYSKNNLKKKYLCVHLWHLTEPSFLAMCVVTGIHWPLCVNCTDLNDTYSEWSVLYVKVINLVHAWYYSEISPMSTSSSTYNGDLAVCCRFVTFAKNLCAHCSHFRIIYKAVKPNQWHSVHLSSFVKQDHSQNEVCSCKYYKKHW